MRSFITLLLTILLSTVITFAKNFEPVPSNIKLPEKYTQDYIDSILFK